MMRHLSGKRMGGGGGERKRNAYLALFLLSYIPVLMAQAKIYWDLGDYQQVEKIFRKSVEFCSEHDVWKLNVAHVLFMQVSENQSMFLSFHKISITYLH